MQFGKMLVIDLECTCFRPDDSDKPTGWTVDTDQEIIEIGASMLDLVTLKILDTKSFLVRPDGLMGNFCRELTTLTYDHVKDKQPLVGALGELKDWSKKFQFDLRAMTWGSWGDYDRIQFDRECARKGINYPFGRSHYNIKGIYSMLRGVSKGYGMEKALELLNMPLEGTHHRGVDDAANTAKILIKILNDARH